MKKVLNNVLAFFFAVSGLIFSSCIDELDQLNVEQEGYVQLSFSSSTSQGGRVEAATPAEVQVSVIDSDGNEVYSLQRFALTNFEGSYLTTPITLSPGDYEITQFLVTDADGKTIYATPKEGSDLAYLVNDPLNVKFSIAADELATIIPTVIPTEERTPNSFGYASFGFSVAETFDFLVTVAARDRKWKLTSARVEVKADGNTIYSKSHSAKTTQVTLLDGFDEYTLKVTKEDHKKYEKKFKQKDIKKYFSIPLLVKLSEEDD